MVQRIGMNKDEAFNKGRFNEIMSGKSDSRMVMNGIQ